jgi:hypothetical protein
MRLQIIPNRLLREELKQELAQYEPDEDEENLDM